MRITCWVYRLLSSEKRRMKILSLAYCIILRIVQNTLDKLLTHILGKFLIPFLHNMYQNKYPLIFIPVAQEPGSCKVKDHITHEYFLSYCNIEEELKYWVAIIPTKLFFNVNTREKPVQNMHSNIMRMEFLYVCAYT